MEENAIFGLLDTFLYENTTENTAFRLESSISFYPDNRYNAVETENSIRAYSAGAELETASVRIRPGRIRTGMEELLCIYYQLHVLL